MKVNYITKSLISELTTSYGKPFFNFTNIVNYILQETPVQTECQLRIPPYMHASVCVYLCIQPTLTSTGKSTIYIIQSDFEATRSVILSLANDNTMCLQRIIHKR